MSRYSLDALSAQHLSPLSHCPSLAAFAIINLQRLTEYKRTVNVRWLSLLRYSLMML
jgi:hypothetical protein